MLLYMENWKVYKHVCPNGKIYFGITSQKLEDRWANGFGYSANENFFKSIVKYGWDNIQHEIICEGLNKEEACLMEMELIKKYKSYDYKYGYNQVAGVRGYHRPEIVKERISNSMIKRAVVQYDLQNNFIAEYESTREAYRQTGIRNDRISRACKGKINTAGGYKWRYKVQDNI